MLDVSVLAEVAVVVVLPAAAPADEPAAVEDDAPAEEVVPLPLAVVVVLFSGIAGVLLSVCGKYVVLCMGVSEVDSQEVRLLSCWKGTFLALIT